MIGKLQQVLFVIGIFLIVTNCKPSSVDEGLRRTKRWDNYENLTFTFDCTNKPIGFYADQEYNCRVFHMCDEQGRRIPHVCADGTSFNQEYRICDWEYNFNCSEAHEWYFLNSLTYASESQEDQEYTEESPEAGQKS